MLNAQRVYGGAQNLSSETVNFSGDRKGKGRGLGEVKPSQIHALWTMKSKFLHEVWSKGGETESKVLLGPYIF